MRAFANLIILAVILAAVAFASAPVAAFYALRSSAQSNDLQGLAVLIDYPAVRASLRPQLSGRPEAMAPPPSFLEDPIGAVRRQLEQQNPAAGAPPADAYLTPQALVRLTRGDGRYASQAPTQGQAPVPSSAAPAPRPRHWGMDRVRMAIVDDGGSETIFTWERRGLFRWMLVHIGLPEGATPPVTANATP